MAVVETSMNFLSRDSLYEREKPYQFRYPVGNGVPKTNLRHAKQEPVKVQNMRGREEQFSFEKNGFTVLKLDEEISYEDFDDPAAIRRYLDLVAKQLRRKLNADTVQVYQYLVSLRLLNPPAENVLLTTPRFVDAMQTSLSQMKTAPTSTTSHLQLLILVCTLEMPISKSMCVADTNPRRNNSRSRGQFPKIEQGSHRALARSSISSCQVSPSIPSHYQPNGHSKFSQYLETSTGATARLATCALRRLQRPARAPGGSRRSDPRPSL